MLKKRVEIIPNTNVRPTDLIGATFTIVGAINTEKPMTVVTADKRTATPVDLRHFQNCMFVQI